MKYLILAAAVLFPSLLFGQAAIPRVIRSIQQSQGQVQEDTLPENYQLNLAVADKDGQPLELSVAVASTRFNAALSEQGLSFSGTISVEESGSFIIAYVLSWQTLAAEGDKSQTKMTSTQGSVRLKLGDEVTIIRAGTRIARLSITKLEIGKAK